MKIFTNKNLIQKLVIAIVCVTLLNFCAVPTAVNAESSLLGSTILGYVTDFLKAVGDVVISVVQLGLTGEWNDAVDNVGSGVYNEDGTLDPTYWKEAAEGGWSIQYPIIQISPELIFGNKVELFDVDFIGGTEDKEYAIEAQNESTISELRTIVASWYVTLRTIAIVGLLAVLIYIGIRIIISSTSQDRAKYKQRLVDWIVAFCLLFFMHYIMAATVTVVDKVNGLLVNDESMYMSIPAEYGTVSYQVGGISGETHIDYYSNATSIGSVNPTLTSNLTEEGVENVVLNTLGISDDMITSKGHWTKIFQGDSWIKLWGDQTRVYTRTIEYTKNSQDRVVVMYYKITDDTGLFESYAGSYTDMSADEFEQSTGNAEGSDKVLYYINYVRLFLNNSSDYSAQGVGWLIIYLILIVFTVMFAVRYMKRVIYVAFLTLIAPLVALTYPIDKIKDGQAQAFNMWFREYVLNVLIQPFHLLIYTILVSSAIDLVSSSVIYAVVAIGFMIPAEKLMRSFFGFDKAGTLSAAGSFAGGALFSSIVSKINRPKPTKGGPGGGGDKKTPKAPRKANSGGGSVEADKLLTGRTTGGDTAQNAGGTGAQAKGNTAQNAGGAGTQAKGDTTQNAGGAGTQAKGDTTQNAGGAGTQAKGDTTQNGISGANTSDSSYIQGVSRWGRLKKSGVKGSLRLLSDTARSVGYTYQRRMVNKAKTLPKSGGRLVRRAAVGAALGAPLAVAGLAIGAASGDPSKAFQYATAGGVAGYYGANHYGDKLAGTTTGLGKTASAAFWGNEAKARQQYLFDKEFKKDPGNIDTLTKTLGSRSKALNAMKDGSVQMLLENGITDPSKIAKALKLRDRYKKDR